MRPSDKTSEGVRVLSPEDLSILALENETVAGHTCKLIVLRDRLEPDALRVSIGSRLGRAPELCVRLCEIGGALCWTPQTEIDLATHVVVREAPIPPDDAGLRTAVAGLFEQRLDRSAPLWRIDVIPELAAGGSALIWRIHHALADGSTAMRIASAALWDVEPEGAAKRGPTRRSRTAALTVHHFEGLRSAAREAPHMRSHSPFDGHVGARRSVAFTSVEFEALHRVGTAHGATVNDVVLSVVAGGLRRWLEARHGHLGAIRVKVPVSLHGEPAQSAAHPGNHDSFFCVDLPLGLSDPLARLAAIRRATRVRKDGHDAEHLDALMRQLARTPRLRQFAESALAHPRSFALNVSNVPGPRGRVSVVGVPVVALYSLAEIREHHALRVAVLSHHDRLAFGLCADPTLLADVDRLAAEMGDEAAALIALGRA